MPKITVHGGPSYWLGEPVEAAEDSEAGLVDAPVEKPAVGDVKAAWVDYAVSQGWLRDDAEAVTKQQLIAQFRD